MKKISLKTVFTVFFIASILFLFVHLVRANYIKWPIIRSSWYLILSFVFLTLAILSNVIAFRLFLNAYRVQISFSNAIESMGLSIFGKYIPGKFWLIAGISSKVSAFTQKPVGTISAIIMMYQIIVLMTGIFVGLPALTHLMNEWLILMLAVSTVAGILVIFSKTTSKIIGRLLNKIRFTEVVLDYISINKSFPSLSVLVLQWIIYSVGFYFMFHSISIINTSPVAGAIFPIATVGGVVVLFAPGGLGIREGILVALLPGFGFSIQDSLTIAAFSRLWFLIGEFFFFLLAVMLFLLRKVSTNTTTRNPGNNSETDSVKQFPL